MWRVPQAGLWKPTGRSGYTEAVTALRRETPSEQLRTPQVPDGSGSRLRAASSEEALTRIGQPHKGQRSKATTPEPEGTLCLGSVLMALRSLLFRLNVYLL